MFNEPIIIDYKDKLQFTLREPSDREWNEYSVSTIATTADNTKQMTDNLQVKATFFDLLCTKIEEVVYVGEGDKRERTLVEIPIEKIDEIKVRHKHKSILYAFELDTGISVKN